MVITMEKENYINVTFEELISKKNKEGYVILDDFLLKNEKDFKRSIGGYYKKYWVNGMDFKILVKEIPNDRFMEFASITYNNLAKQINLESTQYFPALLKKQKVLICKSFLSKGEIALTGGDLIIKKIEKERENFSIEFDYKQNQISKYNNLEKIDELLYSINPNFNKKQINLIKSSLFKMHILDLLCNVNDRHEDNWSIIFKGKDIVKFAPVYDSDWAFLLNQDNVNIKSFLNNKLKVRFYLDSNFHFDSIYSSDDPALEISSYVSTWPIKKIKTLINEIEKLDIKIALNQVKKDFKNIPDIVEKSILKSF